jgi:CRISPR-associated endonuclease/helicase Cas3
MSLLSFDNIIKNDFFDFKILIKDVNSYLAHLSKDNLEAETLLTHSNLVLKYALKLMKDNGIENNINKIIKSATNDLQKQNDIKLFYLKAIYWHDIGKINENFQKDKMRNNSFENIENGISSKHSILSAYLYLLSCFDYINKNHQNTKDRIELMSISIYFSLAIWRHHTGLYSSWKEFLNGSEGVKICSNLYSYVSKLNIEIDNKMHQVLIGHLKNIDFIKNENYYILSKSLFSLLIISDYYATAQFMNYGDKKKLEYNDFRLIDDSFRDDVYKTFYQKQFLENIQNKTNKDFKSFGELQEKSNENLNHLRNKLFVEVRSNLKENIAKNLFYIEAPTGAGKTNLSIMSTVEILQNKNTGINKIFYVFPFTTLITQTYNSIKNVLNLNNSEIVQLHSKAKYNEIHEIKKDGVYGDEKTNFLDNQFMNYPVTLLSHVKFFNILTGVSKDDNYIFHRLANSIVIIDEIQTYNPNLWSCIVYLLDSFASKFNMKFIVMSATLPKVGDILNEPNHKFVKLVSNKQKYFSNPNFRERVEIFTEKQKIKKPQDIFKRVLEESTSYQKLESNRTKKVKTIIEFITKKGADEFYQEAVKKKNFFDEIFILSGTILEPRRREIIDFLKNEKNKNVLLVTTQVVEAGVDIDMDIGFKERSLVDSDEQLAGRINRNSFKRGNKLFLFEMKSPKAKYVYKGDKRLNVLVDENVLATKNFDLYYDQVIDMIKKSNDIPFIEGLDSYIDHVKNLRFSQSHIKIINIESLSVFVPLNDEAVEIWKEYVETIQNQEEDFTLRKIKLISLASEISKFTFSLAKYQGSGIEYLMPYGKEEYGYLYLKKYHQIYSYEDGLDTSVLKGESGGLFI